jgi:hypothetical protein
MASTSSRRAVTGVRRSWDTAATSVRRAASELADGGSGFLRIDYRCARP